MSNKRIISVKIIGILAIILGCWRLFPNFRISFLLVTNFKELLKFLKSFGIFIYSVQMVFCLIIPILLIIGGILLFWLNNGKKLVIIAFLGDFLITLFGIIRLWYMRLTMVQTLIIPEGHVVVARVSIIPFYFTLIIEAVILWYLIHFIKGGERLAG